MRTDETYNGWTNRETWAVALHINNDQGWQEQVHELTRTTVDGITQDPPAWLDPSDLTDVFYANRVGDAIRENVEDVLDLTNYADRADFTEEETVGLPVINQILSAITDIGSMWRVDWREIGAAFLADLDDDTE